MGTSTGDSERRALRPAPAGTDSAWLRVLEAGSLQALPDASLLALGADGVEHELGVDADGLVELPSPGVWFLTLAAPNHVRREFLGRIDAGELVLELEQGGTIEVEVKSESGTPVADVEVALVPPLQAGKAFDQHWRAWLTAERASPKRDLAQRHAVARGHGQELPLDFLDPMQRDPALDLGDGRMLAARHAQALDAEQWRARTDEHGRVRWSGLPPGAGYRVGWLASGRAAIVPHHEFEPYTFEDGRWAVRGRAVEDVSASLVVQLEAPARVAVTAFREASVYGWIDTGGAELRTPSLVKLFHRSTRTAPEAADLALIQMETAVVPALTGQFEIHGLVPGKKRISAHWSVRPGQLCFASVEFEIAAGEAVDLGLLRAQPGYEQAIQVALRDASGQALSPAEVFAPGVVPEVALGIDTLTEPAGLPGALSELVSVPLNETVLLTGLPPGRLYLRAQLGDEYELRDELEVRLTKPEDRWVSCPSTGTEELRFVALRFVEQRLRILWEGGGPVPRLEAHWRAAGAGLSGRTDLRPPRTATTTPEYRLALATGTYEFLVHAHSLEDPSADSGWYWAGALTVSDGAEVVELKLERGSAMGGLVVDGAGSPVPRRLVSFALRDWGTQKSPTWTYRTTTDENGRYRVSSLPPQTEVRTSTGSLMVATGARGSERAVDLLGAR